MAPGGRQDQALLDRVGQILRRVLGGLLAHDGEGVQIERIADARRQCQDALGAGREPLDLPGHQVDDVVGHPGSGDGVHLERPPLPLVVEAEELRLAKRLEELPDEERIATGLLGHEAGQRLGGLEGRNAGCRERDSTRSGSVRGSSDNAPHGHAGLLQLGERAGQRVGRTHLAVAVRADQQQRLDLAVGEQRLQQIERRAVGPLQVIQKDDERMLPPGQGPKKF